MVNRMSLASVCRLELEGDATVALCSVTVLLQFFSHRFPYSKIGKLCKKRVESQSVDGAHDEYSAPGGRYTGRLPSWRLRMEGCAHGGRLRRCTWLSLAAVAHGCCARCHRVVVAGELSAPCYPATLLPCCYLGSGVAAG